ncbi:MAG TPA: FtsX-like permease family protein [Hanamia sp.]|nr:FtsX-like permease family protein [Hanamia sp.]
MQHNKLFSAINIFGLAIGISASLVIFLIVKYDFSFDKFEKDHDRIYRVVTKRDARVPFAIVNAVQNEATGLDVVAPFMSWNDYDLKVSIPKSEIEKPQVFKNEQNIIFADQYYFKLINYKWLEGSPESSLSEPYQTVLSEQNAKHFFPNLPLNDIIGKEIIFNDTIRTTVTGIVGNLKGNTDFNFQTFVSSVTRKSLNPKHLGEWQLFIELSKNSSPQQIKEQIAKIYKSRSKSLPERISNFQFNLQPLSDLHFSTIYDNFDQRKAHLPTLYGLMAVSGILLLLACINFINLTTAQSSERAKEIGIRKTLGGSRKQLIFQFLSETFILTLIATFISVIIAPFLIKIFSDFIPEGVHFNIQQPDVILFLLITTVLVSLFSGIYPALILSSHKPIDVLKNQSMAGSANPRTLFFRKTLTVSQFVIAQFFVIATIVVGRQIHFELTKDMGFKKDAIIYFGTNYRDTSTAKRQVLMQQFKAIPEIANVSLAGFPPSTNGASGFSIKYNNREEEIDTQVRIKPADTNYIKLYGIKLLAGTNLPYSDSSSINNLLINEKCSQMLGFKNPQQAIGKYVGSNMTLEKIPIVGVFQNFIQGSLHDEIMPLVMFNDPKMELTFNVALKPQNAEGTVWKSAIAKIGESFKKIYPDTDLEIHFLDQSIAQYYTAEQNLSKLLRWATGLAIVISCLGLFGLVIYTTNQRTKEIGIRKVVGASIPQIITLLSKDFLKLVLLAFIIAIPIVWLAANKWLQNYAFKIDLSVWLFIIGGIIMLLPALVILLLRTYKAASLNPVESLKSE